MKLFFLNMFLIGLVALSSSCKFESETNINSDEMEQERKTRKFKKLSMGEISQAAFNLGKNEVDSINNMTNNLSGIKCSSDLQSFISERSKTVVSEAKLVCDPSQLKEQKAKMVWEAYFYNLQQNLSLEDNLQEINGEFYFTSPITNEKELKVILIKINKQKLVVAL